MRYTTLWVQRPRTCVFWMASLILRPYRKNAPGLFVTSR